MNPTKVVFLLCGAKLCMTNHQKKEYCEGSLVVCERVN